MKRNKNLTIIKCLILGSLLVPSIGHANSCQGQLDRSTSQLNRCEQRLSTNQTNGERLLTRLSELNRSLDDGNSYTIRDCRRDIRSLEVQEDDIRAEITNVTQRNQRLREKKRRLKNQVAFECIGVEGKILNDSVRAVGPTEQAARDKVKQLTRTHPARKMFRKSTIIGCFAIPKKGGNRDPRGLNTDNDDNDLGFSRRRRRNSPRG